MDLLWDQNTKPDTQVDAEMGLYFKLYKNTPCVHY